MSDHDMYAGTTPVWMIAKNAGIYTRDAVALLQSKGVDVVLDADRKPAIRKSDLLALLSAN